MNSGGADDFYSTLRRKIWRATFLNTTIAKIYHYCLIKIWINLSYANQYIFRISNG
ncbi:hypothetical protein CAMRE0001_2886 [Campylobacter rectus RM3267]|uniref:Uncharacterized protein n=1 Tax=Campylobacter rectus RM3267 TaxID=553218 RepID=B9D252_CAMRE|nr:hypothetical protein CAMRE0001_2886 [Campylobacter rectus RM3267]